MAKRKNPLKDLDSFLKQEASSLVEPEKIASQNALKEPVDAMAFTKEDVLSYFKKLAKEDEQAFRVTFLDIMHRSLEFQGLEKATDKMLMNTLLYLQNEGNWKEAIEEYWSAK
ncbi:MAG: hypothetical protein AAF149_12190 [Bacteroidota bacterium]